MALNPTLIELLRARIDAHRNERAAIKAADADLRARQRAIVEAEQEVSLYETALIEYVLTDKDPTYVFPKPAEPEPVEEVPAPGPQTISPDPIESAESFGSTPAREPEASDTPAPSSEDTPSR